MAGDAGIAIRRDIVIELTRLQLIIGDLVDDTLRRRCGASVRSEKSI